MADRRSRTQDPPVASGRGSTAYPPGNGKLHYGPGEAYRDSFRQPYRGAEVSRSERREPPRKRVPRKRFFFPVAILLGLLMGAAVAWLSTPHGRDMLRITTRLVTPQMSLDEAFMGNTQVRILLVGVDTVREGRHEESHRSDSILVASTDFDSKQIRILSLPRDSWVPHYLNGEMIREADKLGHTYIEGGVQCTKETVEQLLGIAPIQYYATINFQGFQEIIDALGGIEIDVEKDMDYDDNWGNLHIHLKEGKQRLDGKQAMGYARFRKDLMGDIGRMGRQQKVLRAMLAEMQKPENLPRLPTLFGIFHKHVNTNLSMDQLVTLARNMEDFSGDGMQTMTIENYGPYDGAAYAWGRDSHEGRNMAQYLPPTGIDAAREFLLNLDPPPPPEPEPDAQDQGWSEGEAVGDTEPNT